MWRQLDADCDGQITLDEFVDSILHKQYTTGGERACPLRSKQDNLALIRQKSRGWQPAAGEAQAAVMAVEARPVEAKPVASRAPSKSPPTASPRSLNTSF